MRIRAKRTIMTILAIILAAILYEPICHGLCKSNAMVYVYELHGGERIVKVCDAPEIGKPYGELHDANGDLVEKFEVIEDGVDWYAQDDSVRMKKYDEKGRLMLASSEEKQYVFLYEGDSVVADKVVTIIQDRDGVGACMNHSQVSESKF